MHYTLDPERVFAVRDRKIYGQFLEHFHRQIYDGIYDPQSPLSDNEGFRTDVVEALRAISVPIIRWPGGCFVSSYDWKKAVGANRTPSFDKAWRVEESNEFGTDEFIAYCHKLNCEPYICTNAGTGTEEQMSDWMEYCNLDHEGEYARMRIANGHREPHNVRYWSIGNENYGGWEIGAKDAIAWGRKVLEASKMLKRVCPQAELSAAALADPEWNLRLLTMAGERLNWISIHGYWDRLVQVDEPADYDACMAYTPAIEEPVRKVRGMLMALGLEKRISIAYDEWNLRGWHHPNIHSVAQGLTPADYLDPRDRNDFNATYTMADAIFTACFLNMVHRNADVVRMANFAAAVNTRGLLYTYPQGIVKRSMYYVFELYTQYLYDEVLDFHAGETRVMTVRSKEGDNVVVAQIDCIATRSSVYDDVGIACINKHATDSITLTIKCLAAYRILEVRVLAGENVDDYNDIDHEPIHIERCDSIGTYSDGILKLQLPAHSVCVATLRK
ncbi:MAG: alpha-L-arabinofuranosidase C-terminal domain-containing protein [Clostridia bacterium]